MQRKDFEDKKFAAALKGHKLDDPWEVEAKSKMEKIKERAKAKLAGGGEKSVEQNELAAIGIKFNVEDE